MANRDNRGFNTVSESNVSRRDQRIRLQRMTFIAIVAIAALMVIALLVLVIGSIASNGTTNPDNNPSGNNVSNNKITWGTAAVSAADTVKGDLVIVNTSHQYTFPADESHLSNAYNVWNAHATKVYELGSSVRMETNALTAVDKMLTDMATATGYAQSVLASGYRSFDDQESIGSSTKGGYSDHHTGRLCSINTNDAGKTWLASNAHTYGFVMRYPDAKSDKTGVSGYESAYRYVGVGHATFMYENNLCLEEYVEYLKANVTDKKALTVAGYEIYYYTVNGSASVRVPQNFPYTISGTNDGGVVVTINRNLVVEADTTAETSAPANGQ